MSSEKEKFFERGRLMMPFVVVSVVFLLASLFVHGAVGLFLFAVAVIIWVVGFLWIRWRQSTREPT